MRNVGSRIFARRLQWLVSLFAWVVRRWVLRCWVMREHLESEVFTERGHEPGRDHRSGSTSVLMSMSQRVSMIPRRGSRRSSSAGLGNGKACTMSATAVVSTGARTKSSRYPTRRTAAEVARSRANGGNGGVDVRADYSSMTIGQGDSCSYMRHLPLGTGAYGETQRA